MIYEHLNIEDEADAAWADEWAEYSGLVGAFAHDDEPLVVRDEDESAEEMTVTYENAVRLALQDARLHQDSLVIFDDPLTDYPENGTFGFCPAEALPLLAPYATPVAMVRPDGTVERSES